jgi:alpha-1,6-mannosyltransferase
MTVATEAPRAQAPRPAEPAAPPAPARPRARADAGAWLRLAALVLVAGLTQLGYVGFWPMSYYLTQAPEFTYEYLVRYPWVWERLVPLLARFETWFPAGAQSLPFMIDALVRLFLIQFGLYLVAFGLVRAGLPRAWGTLAVAASVLAFQVTLFLMPGLFTTDLFSYTMYGHIAGAYNLNPFLAIPSAFPEVRILQWIHPIWHDAPSIYGPAWVNVSKVVGRAVAEWTDVDKVLAYKALVNLAHLAGVAILAGTVHKLRPGRTLESVALYAWNPLILFELAGNAHNDAAMVAVMLLALLLYASRSAWLGVVALGVSFLIKMSSILLVPYYVVAWAREQRPWWRFFATGALAGATLLAIVVAFYAPWWEGMETVAPIVKWSQGPMYLNYAPDIVARRLAAERFVPFGAVPYEQVLEAARDEVKTVARVVFALFALWELWWARGGRGIAASGARVMLAFLLILNTWVLPWYFTWPLALACVAGWDTLTGKLLVLFSISAPTVMYYHHFWHPYVTDTTYAFYLAPLALVPLYGVVRALHWLWSRVVRARRGPGVVEAGA